MADTDITLPGDGETVSALTVNAVNGTTKTVKLERIVLARPDGSGGVNDVDAGDPLPVSVSGVAQDTSVDEVTASLGTDGSSPPALPGSATGVRGWLRGIYSLIQAVATEATLASAKTDLDSVVSNQGGPGSSQPSLVNGGTGILGYLRNILDALRGTLAVAPASAGDVVSSITDGRATVTTPGTPVPLEGSSSPCKWVTITALATNTDQVNVGGSAVRAALGSDTGTPIGAGGGLTLPIDDAHKVFVDARVAGEGVTFTFGS